MEPSSMVLSISGPFSLASDVRISITPIITAVIISNLPGRDQFILDRSLSCHLDFISICES
jgi:hypothetical protein